MKTKIAFSFLFSLLLLAACKKDQSANGNGGCITTNIANPVISQSINFTDCINGAISAAWDFGDGTVGSGIIIAKTYSTAGSYSVKLISTSTGGQTITVTKTIVISSVPAAHFSYGECSAGSTTFTNYLGDTVWFTADPGYTSYLWTFSDGGTSTSASVAHVFRNPLEVTVKLKVTNAAGTDSSSSTFPPQNPFSGYFIPNNRSSGNGVSIDPFTYNTGNFIINYFGFDQFTAVFIDKQHFSVPQQAYTGSGGLTHHGQGRLVGSYCSGSRIIYLSDSASDGSVFIDTLISQ